MPNTFEEIHSVSCKSALPIPNWVLMPCAKTSKNAWVKISKGQFSPVLFFFFLIPCENKKLWTFYQTVRFPGWFYRLARFEYFGMVPRFWIYQRLPINIWNLSVLDIKAVWWQTADWTWDCKNKVHLFQRTAGVQFSFWPHDLALKTSCEKSDGPHFHGEATSIFF